MAIPDDDLMDLVGSEPPYIRLAQGYNIRLVELLPGAAKDPLETRLWIHGLGHAPSFDAISYVWGDQRDTVKITCNSQILDVTRNLSNALHRMRYSDKPRLLWADAICICQADAIEKKHHVSFMDRVYRRANKVLAHMPARSDANPRDVALLVNEHDIRLQGRRLQDMPLITDDDPLLNDKRWSSLPGLLKSEWFSRTWVLQETGVARNPVVLYGDEEFSYRGLMQLLRWITKCAPQLLGRYSISYVSIHTDWENWTANWRSLQDHTYSAVDLLSHAKGLGCNDPKDRIYAFLGHPLLRTDDNKPMLMPDYSEEYTELELYTDFTRHLLCSDSGIKALSAVEHDESSINQHNVPSWTIRWTMDIIWNSMGYYVDFYYRASGMPETGGPVRIEEDALLVQGIPIDTVKNVFMFSEIEDQWLVAPAAVALTSDDQLRSLLVCIFSAALGTNNEHPIYDDGIRWDALSLSLCTGLMNYERAEDNLQRHQANFAAFWQLLFSVSTHHGSHGALLENTRPPAVSGGSADRFYDDILLACKGRSFFITKQGYFGLGPLITKPEDQCFVLKGARVPFVMRSSGEGTCKLVGECYLHGVMDGSFVADRELPWQELRIV